MEQTKRSTFKLLFYLKKNEPKKNGAVAIIGTLMAHPRLSEQSWKLTPIIGI